MHKILSMTALLIIFTACQSNEKTKEQPNETIEEVPAFESVDFDPSPYLEKIESLEGIERFFVTDDLFRLHALLKQKDDAQYLSIEQDLKAKYEYPEFLSISTLDAKNGYIAFEKLATECRQEMVFWNLSNGQQLIGHTMTCCTMFCEGAIDFLRFDPSSESYEEASLTEVIPTYNQIVEARGIQMHEGGMDYEFKLPREGKDLQYCENQECQTLSWNDGVFLSASD